jgi:Flp pilus assembly protein TadD
LLGTWALGPAFAQTEDCGHPRDGPGRFGPFDYNDRARLSEEIAVVERHHYTKYMEDIALYGFSSEKADTIEEQRGGKDLIAGNFDYTLYAFPNHHAALHAMATWQLGLREKSMAEYETLKRSWGFRSAECYFERALMMAPNDWVVYLVYGVFLHKLGNLEGAKERYDHGLQLMASSPELHYNLGLLFFDQRNYQAAAKEAQVAYELGYPLQGLKRKLASVGFHN